MTTLKDFAVALLNSLGMPQSANNIQTIVSAEVIEGGFTNNSALYNPLNTSQQMPGSQSCHNLSPNCPENIQAYTSWPQGLAAITKTLQNGYYNDILAALKASAPPDETLRVWQLNPMYGWYHCIDPVTGMKDPVGSCPAGHIKVPNPIGTAADYWVHANDEFPSGPALSHLLSTPAAGTSPGFTPLARLSLLGFVGYVAWKMVPLIWKRI